MDRKRIWTVMKAEFLHILRDPLSLVIALVMPLFMLFLCAYTITLEFRELPIAVFDMDRSAESRNYIKAVDHTSHFDVKYYLTEYDQAEKLLSTGKIRCAIIIPSRFSREAREYRPANIQSLVDASDMNMALTVVNYLSAINASYSLEMATDFLQKNGLAVDLEPVVLVPRLWYNQALKGFTFIVTGAFSFTILGFVPILTALAIVREKESGSIQQIFASPIRSQEYIAGKMAPYVIFLTMDFIAVILLGLWHFNIPFRGNFLILSLATSLMVFGCVAIGFLISTLTKSQLTAMLLGIIFTLMPSFIFGDALTPIENDPDWGQLATYLFPVRFYTEIVRAEILRASGIHSYWEDAVGLVTYCLVVFSICAWKVRKKKI